MRTQEELTAMSAAALREFARELGVRGYSRLRREELLSACQAACGLAASAGDDGDDTAVASAPAPAAAEVAWPEPISSPASAEPRVLATDVPFMFPQSYGVDRVVLLVRDPQWMFCYWDVSAETWERVAGSGITDPASGWRRVLRLHDVSSVVAGEPCEATRVCDIEVGPDATDFYFQTPRPNREYRVEFGYLSAVGEFIRLAVSNVVSAPRNAPSEQADEAWGQLYDDALRLSLAGVGEAGVASAGAGGFPGSVDAARGLSEFLAERISSGPFSAAMVVSNRY
ncbi:MAG: DUF4912 domain-containing protein [Armatimonadetes bacterium]|nr:DUF4912 domain-containing protein [Armatimonadota bacterium]